LTLRAVGGGVLALAGCVFAGWVAGRLSPAGAEESTGLWAGAIGGITAGLALLFLVWRSPRMPGLWELSLLGFLAVLLAVLAPQFAKAGALLVALQRRSPQDPACFEDTGDFPFSGPPGC
jgi:hypothetical protein